MFFYFRGVVPDTITGLNILQLPHQRKEISILPVAFSILLILVGDFFVHDFILFTSTFIQNFGRAKFQKIVKDLGKIIKL